jgi:hypothetical protein
MDLIADTNKFVIAKGFIDGKDASGRPVHGLFISASACQKILYFKEIFTNEPIDRTLPWPALLAMLNDENADMQTNHALARRGKEFHEFVVTNRLLEYGRGHMDAKDIERRISYFCSNSLDLSAVTFLDLTTVEEDDLYALMPFISEQSGAPDEEEHGGEPGADIGEDRGVFGDEEETPGEVFIACEPVLDPVSGVAISGLSVGDTIVTRLPETSSFYQFLVNKNPAFDGNIEGDITGVRMNEYDMAVVAVKLADGISGTMKLSESVRVKRVERLTDGAALPPEKARISTEVIFAALSVAIFLMIMGFLMYKIN